MLTLAILGEDDRQIGGMDTAGPSAKRDGRNQLIPDRSLGTLAKALGAPATRRMAIVTAEANCRSLAACESQEPHRRGAE
jgi:hypothetical protein